MPLIDSTDRTLGNSVIYFCESNFGLIRDHVRIRDKISRMIDKVQL
jgi:hypothetical protein